MRQPSSFEVVKNIKQTRTHNKFYISFFYNKALYFQYHIQCSTCPPLISFLYTGIITLAKLLRIPAAFAFTFCPHVTPFPL